MISLGSFLSAPASATFLSCRGKILRTFPAHGVFSGANAALPCARIVAAVVPRRLFQSPATNSRYSGPGVSFVGIMGSSDTQACDPAWRQPDPARASIPKSECRGPASGFNKPLPCSTLSSCRCRWVPIQHVKLAGPALRASHHRGPVELLCESSGCNWPGSFSLSGRIHLLGLPLKVAFKNALPVTPRS